MTEHKRVISFIVTHGNQDGEFIAFRTKSPLFCFLERTEKEAISKAEAAIKSYANLRLHEN